MRAALRDRKTIHVTRKDVADYAGVTSALITYYFPQKNDLIEAVTVPIVQDMLDAVELSLTVAVMPRERLLGAIDILIASYARDAAIIDLFAWYRASRSFPLTDPLGKIEAALLVFFEDWLKHSHDNVFDAVYLQKATIGMCKIVARRNNTNSVGNSQSGSEALTQAEAICAILLGPVADGQRAGADAAPDI